MRGVYSGEIPRPRLGLLVLQFLKDQQHRAHQLSESPVLAGGLLALASHGHSLTVARAFSLPHPLMKYF